MVSGHRKMGVVHLGSLLLLRGTCRFLHCTVRAFTSVKFVMAMGIEVCYSSHLLRYFSALSKGAPLPVKERIELSLATEKEDAGLTPGLLKVLHKQVQAVLYQIHNALEAC